MTHTLIISGLDNFEAENDVEAISVTDFKMYKKLKQEINNGICMAYSQKTSKATT